MSNLHLIDPNAGMPRLRDGGGGDGSPPMDKTVNEIDKRLIAVEAVLPGLVTKSDMAELRSDMHRSLGDTKSDMAELRSDMHRSFGDIMVAISELKSKTEATDSKIDIASIRQTVEKSHTDIYKWIATIFISVAGIGFAAYSGLKSVGAGQQVAAQPPTIIQIPPSMPQNQTNVQVPAVTAKENLSK